MNKEKVVQKIKPVLYFIGKTLGFLGLFFVLYKFSQEYTIETFVDKLFSLKASLIYLMLMNIVSLLLGIYAWHLLLKHYSTTSFSYITSYYYFAKTEISKYLPGNIFHFVGRQLLANKLSITQKQMINISMLFSFLLVVATIISSTLLAFLAVNIPAYILILLSLASIFVILLTFFTYPSITKKTKLELNAILVLSVGLQGIMLATLVFTQINDDSFGIFFQMASLYIVSWLIGFITPGASGGLGVREGAFIAMSTYLQIGIADEVILFSILMTRLINILTDTLLFLSTFTLSKRVAI